MATRFLSIGPTASTLVDLPAPNTYQVTYQDVSSADSGRVNDATNTMHKMRTSKKVKIQLGWKNLGDAETALVLQAVDPEYFYARFWDPQTGTFEVKQFYAGDRAAEPVFFEIGNVVYKSLSFNIIER